MVTVFSGFTASDPLDDFDMLYERAVLDKVRIKREEEEAKKKAEEDRIAAEKKAEKDRIAAEKKNKVEKSMGISAQNPEEVLSKMVKITGMEKGDFYILNTEVTLGLYCKVMGNKGVKEERFCYPVEISCVEALDFCNKLSELCGLKPYYGVPKVVKKVKNHRVIDEKLTCKTFNTNGFRLPNTTEWLYAAAGGENFKYFGSDEIDEVCWYEKNSKSTKNIVAAKKPNKFGLYDMSGNLYELCLNATQKDGFDCYTLGGYFGSTGFLDSCSFAGNLNIINQHKTDFCTDSRWTGLRIVRNAN